MDGVTMRVVRWNHSGDTTNPIQHFAREIYRPPVPDASGGFRVGVGEDFPNGGGNRAFLFTVQRPGQETLSFFVNNSASAFDLDKDIVVDGQSFGSPLGNLQAAMKDAGLAKVDAWIGTGCEPVAKLVVPVIKPRTYIPSHWGLFNAFWPGLPYPFKDNALSAYLKAQNVNLLPQKQYFDKYILTNSGVQMEANTELKQKLGFATEQKFSRTMLDAVDRRRLSRRLRTAHAVGQHVRSNAEGVTRRLPILVRLPSMRSTRRHPGPAIHPFGCRSCQLVTCPSRVSRTSGERGASS